MSYRGNTQRNSNNSNDGQTGAKRRRPNRWSNKGRNESESYDIDTPIFKTPFSPQRSPNPRSRQSYSYDNGYNYNDQQYVDDRYDAFDSPGYRTLASPGQPRRPQQDTRNRQFVEPQHSGPAWYWDQYFNEINNWQDKHKLSYYKSRCMALEFENQMLFEQVKSLIEENSVIASERGEVPTMLLPNFPGGLKGFENENATAEKPSASKTPVDKGKNRKSSDESLVCDVPDSMIAVIEKSMRHKLNLCTYTLTMEGPVCNSTRPFNATNYVSHVSQVIADT